MNSWSLSREYYEKGDSKPLIIVDPETGGNTVGVPYVFEYYGDRVPFGLKLTYITHNVVANPVVRVDQAVIMMADGKAIDIADTLRSQLTLEAQAHHFIDGRGESRAEKGLRGEVLIPNCVPSKAPFTLHLIGAMSSGGRIVERFDATMRFAPNSEVSVHNRVFSE